MQLHERIKAAREERDMSLSDLARVSGISRGYLHLLESGKETNPTIDKLCALSNALFMPIGYLLGEQTNSTLQITSREANLISAVRDKRYGDAMRILANHMEDGQ